MMDMVVLNVGLALYLLDEKADMGPVHGPRPGGREQRRGQEGAGCCLNASAQPSVTSWPLYGPWRHGAPCPRPWRDRVLPSRRR